MEYMRLDKFLGACGACSRAEAKRVIRSGGVSVNGTVARTAEQKIDPDSDRVVFCGKPLVWRKYTYILLNKPKEL